MKKKTGHFLGSFPLYSGKVGEIFMVTAITGPPGRRSKGKYGSRCFGWFIDLDDAVKAVGMNSGDMHEMEYNYVVIEKVRSGICGGGYITEAMQWFKYKPHKRYLMGSWIPCKKPKWSEHICNFSMG